MDGPLPSQTIGARLNTSHIIRADGRSRAVRVANTHTWKHGFDSFFDYIDRSLPRPHGSDIAEMSTRKESWDLNEF
jgi:hypothetical protein